MATIRSYRDLTVWQDGRMLVKEVYELSKRFPREEVYGLTNQVRRAAVSVPSNIAEGHARDSTKEDLHHISIAIGSLAEIETQVILSSDLDYSSTRETDLLLTKTESLGRRLRTLQTKLKSKVNS